MSPRSETISPAGRGLDVHSTTGHWPSQLSTLATMLAMLGGGVAWEAEPGNGCVTSMPTTIGLVFVQEPNGGRCPGAGWCRPA